MNHFQNQPLVPHSFQELLKLHSLPPDQLYLLRSSRRTSHSASLTHPQLSFYSTPNPSAKEIIAKASSSFFGVLRITQILLPCQDFLNLCFVLSSKIPPLYSPPTPKLSGTSQFLLPDPAVLQDYFFQTTPYPALFSYCASLITSNLSKIHTYSLWPKLFWTFILFFRNYLL